MRRSILVWIATLALPATSTAVGIQGLDDHFDNFQSVLVAQMMSPVSDGARDLRAFVDENIPHNLHDVEALLGPPASKYPDATYAMPLCQKRMVVMTGAYRPPSRRHVEFYPVDDVGGLQVWYLHDSTTVAAVVVCLKADPSLLPYNRQTQNQLGTRVAWDRDHVAALEQAIRDKVQKVHDRGGPERAVFGAWRVTGSRCPADCAMSPREADAWRGRTATYEDSLAQFADNACQRPHYNPGYWPADGRYGGVRLAQVGVMGDSALVVEVQCDAQRRTGSDPRWQVPGAFLIVKDHDHLLMVWEGVFFELTRQ